MARRRKMSKAVSKTVFQKSGMKINSINVQTHPQRGGYRL